jgi:hypothetical protein
LIAPDAIFIFSMFSLARLTFCSANPSKMPGIAKKERFSSVPAFGSVFVSFILV